MVLSWPTRALLQSPANSEEVAVVNTASELAVAIEAGRRDIQIKNHIDLRDIEVDSGPPRGNVTLPVISSGTRALWADCDVPPSDEDFAAWDLPSPDLLPLKPRQCIVICDRDCFRVTKPDGLWMHNVYVRFVRTARTLQTRPLVIKQDPFVIHAVPDLLSVYNGGLLWATNLTLQGDSTNQEREPSRGVTLDEFTSRLFAQDCIIDSLGGRQNSIVAIRDGSAAFHSCTFQQLWPRGRDMGIIMLMDVGSVLLDRPVFAPHTGAYEVGLSRSSRGCYCDTLGSIDIYPLERPVGDTPQLDEELLLGLPLEDATPDMFSSADSPFYIETRSAILGDLPVAVAGGSSGSGLGSLALAVIAVACVVVVAGLLALLFCWGRRRRSRGAPSPDTSEHLVGAKPGDSDSVGKLHRLPSPEPPRKSPFSAAASVMFDAAGEPLFDGAAVLDSSGPFFERGPPSSGSVREPPGPDASLPDRMRWVHWQLDNFSSSTLILGKYKSLGPSARRQGGQAVVQFCRSVVDTCEYAVKVFAARSAFTAEAAMYNNPAMHDLLPRVEAIHSGDDAGGGAAAAREQLSPCIVMEKGESLDQWSQRGEPDTFMSVTVLANVAQRLVEFHRAGYVHRDLKPANVMWLPRANRWTIIDFGCAAAVGARAPLSFTLVYAAPEVVAAVKARQGAITAAPAVDAWALGVMAYELLTGRAVFHLEKDGKDEIMAQLSGEKPLPWEETSVAAEEQLQQLGAFKDVVLALLHRDPAQRPSMEQFYAAAKGVYSSNAAVPT